MALLFSIVVLVLTGSCWGRALTGRAGWPLRLALYLAAGVLHLHLAALGIALLGLPWSRGLLGLALLLQASAVWRWARPAGGAKARPTLLGWGDALAVVPVLAFAFVTARGGWVSAEYLAHQGAKAHRLFVAGTFDWAWLGSPWSAHLQPGAPNLLPHLYAGTALAFERYRHGEAMAWSVVFFCAVLLAVRELLCGSRRSDAGQAWLAGLAFATSAIAISGRLVGTSDWILAFALMAALPALTTRGRRPQDLQVAILAAMAASTSRAGIFLAVFLLLGRFFAGPRSRSRGRILLLVFPTALTTVVWLGLGLRYGLSSGSLVWPSPSRWVDVVGSLTRAPVFEAWRGVQWLFLFLPLALVQKRWRIATSTVLAQAGLLLGGALCVPGDSVIYVTANASRTLLQLLPATWVICGRAVASAWPIGEPEAAGERVDRSRRSSFWDSQKEMDPIRREWTDLIGARDLIRLWTVRGLTLRYKRSVLGVFWTLLEPLAVLSILTVVFSTVFRFDLPDYPVYLLPGWLAWDFFSKSTLAMSSETLEGVRLTTHLPVARSAFAVSALLIHLVNWAIASGLMIGVLFFVGRPPSLEWLLVPVGMALLAVFALGVGLIVSTLNALFRDFGALFQLFLTIWLYTTPLIYPLQIIPERVQPLFLLNPLTHLVELIRAPIYLGQAPDASTWVAGVTFGVGTLWVGWWVFSRSREEVTRRA